MLRRTAAGPWAECAEADWVREVVRHAGYTTGTDTGSALVASTNETGFYIWTTADTERAAERDGWHRLATVANTPIYGDGRVWRFWSAQGFMFWTTAGPSAADVPLSMTALKPLIDASKEVPPPSR